MVTGDPGVDKEMFYALEAWTIVTRELLLRKELKLRGISYSSLLYIYLALVIPP